MCECVTQIETFFLYLQAIRDKQFNFESHNTNWNLTFTKTYDERDS